MLSKLQRETNLKFLNFSTVKAFQSAYGLVADNIYGVKTDAKLTEVIKEIQKLIGTTADGKVGAMTKARAKIWQSSQGLTPDGIFGAKSRARMKEYLNSWDCIKYFKKSDFNCPCCGKNNMRIEVVKIADQIRAHFGKPAHITSGTRCVKHNAKQKKSVPNSRHLDGRAIDMYVDNVSGGTLLAYCKTLVANKQLRYTYRISDTGMACHIDIL